MQKIEIITLGELRCVSHGTDTRLPSQKLRFALLAYLACERSAPRSKLTALFYPEVNERQAYRRLNQLVYAIRQELGDCIQSVSGELRARDVLVSDACRFGNLTESGDYACAFELYRRPFLDGFYLNGASEWERWAERRRAVLERTFAQTARLLTAGLMEQGEFTEAADYASRWIERDNDNEDAHRVFMTALLRAGRGNDALRHYKAWERALMEDSGEAPSEQMVTFLNSLRKLAAAAGVAHIAMQEPEREGPAVIRPALNVLTSHAPSNTAPNGAAGLNRFKRAIRRYLDRRLAVL